MTQAIMKSSSANILSGVGIGFLLGTIVGLSSTPVVGIVVGALATGLLALLGLKEPAPTVVQELRLAAFGLACTAGLVIGLTLRTSDMLSPRLTAQQQQWKAIGFSEDEAKKIVLYRSTGLLMGPLTPPTGNSGAAKTATALFSSVSPADVCTSTETSQYANMEEHVKALKQAGGSLGRLADVLKDLKADDQRHVLEIINHWACGQ